LINAKGEIVGLLFDGNITDLRRVVRHREEPRRRRASSHHREALSKVYAADAVLAELAR
jgi:hypothetical protein